MLSPDYSTSNVSIISMKCCQSKPGIQRSSTSTRWHFAFGAMLSQQRKPCADCKSAQQCTTRGHPCDSPQLTSLSLQ